MHTIIFHNYFSITIHDIIVKLSIPVALTPAASQDDLTRMNSQSLLIPLMENYFSHSTARRLPNVGSVLERRRRRRANIEPTLGKRLVFAG